MTEELQLIPSTLTADGYYVPPTWSGGRVTETERGRAVTLWWCLRAAESRAAESGKENVGFAVWSAAVEAVWWIVALEDGLIDMCGDERWKRLLRGSPDDQVLRGLRWL
ncbi:hypothetical protein [Rathayibacter sp. VKM Ac-2928]|uniref:hypothetical protein n=1 Tax=Rathayibacter sp. VKM Ac-2928 TaxID=2929479 RepID=UPI001FB44822|nr:hypothetical protein [Rathayibacter sp. VKM Ac-2928]MCJ1682340.1 hypothetical protein [Rathayibacter sp. VKM Ac-2928]